MNSIIQRIRNKSQANDNLRSTLRKEGGKAQGGLGRLKCIKTYESDGILVAVFPINIIHCRIYPVYLFFSCTHLKIHADSSTKEFPPSLYLNYNCTKWQFLLRDS
jgi:hypothetical protein